MQNQNLPLLLIHRENYKVPKGEEQSVHYKLERVAFDANENRISHPDLVKTNPKMFDIVKSALETAGYTIEILFHPDGKYSNVVIPVGSKLELEQAKAELAAKDEEIAKLRAAIDASKGKKDDAPQNEEASAENAPENEEAKPETPAGRRGGRTPKKSE